MFYIDMNINFNPQNENNIKSYSSKMSFEGMRQLIGSETVKAFLKRTKILGDVVINKRTGSISTTPTTVSLVRTISGKKGDKDSKVIFALFEKGFEKTKNVAEIDAKELGLVEVKYKNLSSTSSPRDNDIFSRSIRDLLKNYNEGIKVLYLVSHEGDKYQGIGTKLLDAIVAFSQKLGVNNKVFLHSKNLIPAEYLKCNSKYSAKRLGIAPTQFYYNYGFTSDATTNRMFHDAFNKSTVDDMFMRLPENFSQKNSDEVKLIKGMLK